MLAPAIPVIPPPQPRMRQSRTRCIRTAEYVFAKIRGRWFEADRPLSDGSGNPPPGWGNPVQPGTIRMLSASVAEFRDSLGHVVRFLLIHEHAGAHVLLPVCA
jgi:hypothetical protein